jgi:NADPH:quinone reductase-like Zn-dependent oxidoreductase
MSLPEKIKAVVQPDSKSTKLVETTIPIPAPGSGYLVKVKATSPCPRERTWASLYPDLYTAGAVVVPGTEGAGVVVTAPADGRYKVGDEVFYRTDAWLLGSMAEYIAVPAENVALKPASLSWSEAAATPLSSLTSWQGLFEHANLDPNALDADPKVAAAAREKNAKKRVLITGAVGGVGSWGLKFASAAGAGAVVAVCAGAKAADAKAFGATEIVDYTTTSVDKWAAEDPKREVDIILDCVGADLSKYWAVVKDGGSFLSMVGDPAGAKPADSKKQLADAKWYLVQPRGSDLQRIANLVEKKNLKPLIDSVVPFSQFAEAFDKVDSGKTKGKVVITVPE